MSLYILIEFRKENRYNLGIYSSKKKANKAVEKLIKENSSFKNSEFYLEKRRVNQPAKTRYMIPVRLKDN